MMVIELVEGDESRVRWNYGDGWHYADIDDLIRVYESVVRCKDCKFFDHDDFGKGEEYWCKHFISTDDTTYCHRVNEDDFCAWGERREDGNT